MSCLPRVYLSGGSDLAAATTPAMSGRCMYGEQHPGDPLLVVAVREVGLLAQDLLDGVPVTRLDRFGKS